MSVEARLFNENPNNGYSLRVTTSRVDSRVYISEALFPSCLKASYCVNCVLDGSWVLTVVRFLRQCVRGQELSDKYAAVVYVYYKTGIRTTP